MWIFFYKKDHKYRSKQIFFKIDQYSVPWVFLNQDCLMQTAKLDQPDWIHNLSFKYNPDVVSIKYCDVYHISKAPKKDPPSMTYYIYLPSSCPVPTPFVEYEEVFSLNLNAGMLFWKGLVKTDFYLLNNINFLLINHNLFKLYNK